jgi:simple sugar transport system permease protein
MFLGLATTRFNVDHIVAGIGLNILAQGATAAALVLIFGQPGTSPEVPSSLGQHGEVALIIIALLLSLLLDRALMRTPWGLRVRACGENPLAVRSAGLDPRAIRLGATLLGSAIVGLGGVYLSLGELNVYSDGMTAGRGFIALAAIILGRWTPLGACGAALLFGAFSALQFILQRAGIPSELMQAIPYLVTLAAISGIGGKARPPAADGVPLEAP